VPLYRGLTAISCNNNLIILVIYLGQNFSEVVAPKEEEVIYLGLLSFDR
jgi:hypothetical protein